MSQQVSNKVSEDMILPSFRKHLIKQSHIMLHNTFLGVPISYEAEVALVNPGFIGLIVHPYQAVCIKTEAHTFIRSSMISTLISACPISIDYTHCVVMLNGFRIPKHIDNDLYHSWISPDKPVDVEIQFHNRSCLSAKLIQIAVLDDNCIRAVLVLSKDTPISPFDALKLTFQLDKNQAPVQVEGDLISSVKINDEDSRRLDIAGRATMEDEITILAYIAQREDQIMGQLDKAYRNLRSIQ